MFKFKEYCTIFDGYLGADARKMRCLMNIAVYIGKEELSKDARVSTLLDVLVGGGCDICLVRAEMPVPESTDMLLSVGGDGTFLSAAMMVAGRNIPVAGVNLGRMGFLSENRPEDFAQAILAGEYTVESRAMLHADVHTGNPEIDDCPFALNEMTVRRSGPAMLTIDVCVNGEKLPAYWGDGLIISTSSGSTAYSLSVGGPIAMPDAKVFIISPIAPHNLNVRPLVVPYSSEISLVASSRDGHFELAADNRTAEVPENTEVRIRMAQFSLKRIRLNNSNFIQALSDKLYWGEDVRNII